MAEEYSHIEVLVTPVAGNERKERHWRMDGHLLIVNHNTTQGTSRHEIYAIEDPPGWPGDEYAVAFITFLNKLANDGWRVISHRSDSGWPQGDFLLVREFMSPPADLVTNG